MIEPPNRTATPDDAAVMAELVNMAGEGMPFYLWSKMATPGESAWDIGRTRARREQGGFSYRNTVIREEQGYPVACLIGYPLNDEPEAVDFTGMPPMFVPLQELEDLAHGTWYVNVLATYPEYRGKGYGSELLQLAEEIARETNMRGLSLIVADTNTGARRLYKRHGYHFKAQRKMEKEKWKNPGQNWLLLIKPLES